MTIKLKNSIYDFSVETIDSKIIKMSTYRNKILLIVVVVVVAYDVSKKEIREKYF